MFKINGNKVRIRKTDKFRALLTETLPYEVPMLFSNEGLYLAAKDGTLEEFDKNHGLDIFKDRHTVPYKYKIRKNAYEFRGLSVMHPAQQLSTGAFYSKYDHLIVGLCQRSPFALRAPGAIASYFVERMRAVKNDPAKNKNVEEMRGGFEAAPSVATSYFSYKKYAFMFRFYDSSEFLTLEKKFKFLSKLDISDCFNRIYTHTISWATKSKSHAKNNRHANTFESAFDALMQNANHGETAGIIIGPEISRIFAEIILQRIDLDILKKASDENLINETHYTIRRYVDDYFVYCNSESTQEELKKIISDCLAEYKLAINATKTLNHTRPFVTGTSISRHNISNNINEFFNKYREFESTTDAQGKISTQVKIKPMSGVSAVANQTIASLKRSIGENGSYDVSANYFFGTIKRLLGRLVGKPLTAENDSLGNNLYYFLSALVDVVFFYYSMTPRVRQTYLTSEIILMIVKIMEAAPIDLKDSLTRKIVHESRLVIMHGSVERTAYKVEVMNLLIVLRGLGEKYILDQASILHVFNIKQNADGNFVFPENFDYFQNVFLFSYLGGIPEYNNILRAAASFCIGRFNKIDWAQNAECVFLFFDFITCPYVEPREKTEMAKVVLRHKSDRDINERAASLINGVGVRPWFFGWNMPADLSLVLKKKELRTPY